MRGCRIKVVCICTRLTCCLAHAGTMPPGTAAEPWRTFWHLTLQNQTVWHLLHFKRFCVSPQLAADGVLQGGVSMTASQVKKAEGERT